MRGDQVADHRDDRLAQQAASRDAHDGFIVGPEPAQETEAVNGPGVGPDMVLAGPAVRQQGQRLVFLPGMDQCPEVSSQVLRRQVDPQIHLFQVGLPMRLDQLQDLAGLARCRRRRLASSSPRGDGQHGGEGQ